MRFMGVLRVVGRMNGAYIMTYMGKFVNGAGASGMQSLLKGKLYRDE
jgi:hypothetical protein